MPANSHRLATRFDLWEGPNWAREYRRCRTWAPRLSARASCRNDQPAARQRHLRPERRSVLRHVQLSYAHSHHDLTAGLAAATKSPPVRPLHRISAAKGQGMVKERYLNRVNIVLLR